MENKSIAPFAKPKKVSSSDFDQKSNCERSTHITNQRAVNQLGIKSHNSYNSFMSPIPEHNGEPSTFAQNIGDGKQPCSFLSGEHSFKTARLPDADEDINTFAQDTRVDPKTPEKMS